jgi:GT2 family glycosyltransferase
MRKHFQARVGASSAFARCRVDILVPFHGHIDKVARLVHAILGVTRSNPYRITLIDDASPDPEFVERARRIPQVRAIRLEQQAGFAGALEAGFRATEQPGVQFMHSDCIPQEVGWMLRLGESLLDLARKKVGMVSARSNNPGDDRLLGKKGEVADDVILKDGALPLFCSLSHRDLYGRIGGFLKNYEYAMYEDQELAYRMRRFGYQQAVCGKSWVFHEGGVTIDALLKQKPWLRKVMEANREKCIQDIKKTQGAG